MYLESDADPKTGWVLVLLFKAIVLGAIALLAAGGSALQGTDPKPSSFTLVKVGIAIMVVAWAVLVGWTVQTIYTARAGVKSRAGRLVSGCGGRNAG